MESVGGKTVWYNFAGKSTAHRDYPDSRKLTPDYREQFKSGHPRHVEIGEKDIGNRVLYFKERREAVFRRSDAMSKRNEELRERHSKQIIIIDNKNFHFCVGHRKLFQSISTLAWREYAFALLSLLCNFAHICRPALDQFDSVGRSCHSDVLQPKPLITLTLPNPLAKW